MNLRTFSSHLSKFIFQHISEPHEHLFETPYEHHTNLSWKQTFTNMNTLRTPYESPLKSNITNTYDYRKNISKFHHEHPRNFTQRKSSEKNKRDTEMLGMASKEKKTMKL